MTRVRAGLILVVFAAFLGVGAQAAFGVLANTSQDAGATGTTGVQVAGGSCPNPKLTGLPKHPKFTNATIHYKLTHMTKGASFITSAGPVEVDSAPADSPTMKRSFQMPDQGTKSKPVPITVVVATDQCGNSPWKLVKKIQYKAVVAPTPAAPATPATPATPAPGAVNPAKPATPATPAKPIVPPPAKQLTPKLPPKGPPLSIRAWMSPLDSGARSTQLPPEPALARTERRADKAKSSSALIGLGILFLLLTGAAVGALSLFRRRDDQQYEAAAGAMPAVLEEGDPGLIHSGQEGAEEAAAPPLATQLAEDTTLDPPAEELAVAEGAAPAPGEAPTVEEPAPAEPVVAAVPTEPHQATPEIGPEAAPEAAPAVGEQHRQEVEAELQRILDETGIEGQLHGILRDAEAEAERLGIVLDPDLMLQALCDELNGSARLSDQAREQLRQKFQEILAEENGHPAGNGHPVGNGHPTAAQGAEQVPQQAS